MTAFYVSGDIEGTSGFRPGLDKAAQDRILHAHFIAAAEGLPTALYAGDAHGAAEAHEWVPDAVPPMPERFRLDAPLKDEAAAAVAPKVLPCPVTVSGNRVAYDAADFAGMYRFFHDMFNLAGAVTLLRAGGK